MALNIENAPFARATLVLTLGLSLTLTALLPRSGYAAEAPVAATAPADARAALIEEIIKTAGWDLRYPFIEREMLDRARGDSRIRTLTYPAYREMSGIVRSQLSTAVLLAEARSRLKTALQDFSDAELAAFNERVKAPLPQRLFEQDRFSYDLGEQGLQVHYKSDLETKAPAKDRLELTNRYLAATGLRAAYMRDQTTQLKAMLLAAEPTLADDELKQQMDTLAPEVDKRVRVSLQADILARYRKFSDEDFRAMVEFLEQPEIAKIMQPMNEVDVSVKQHALGGLLKALGDADARSKKERASGGTVGTP